MAGTSLFHRVPPRSIADEWKIKLVANGPNGTLTTEDSAAARPCQSGHWRIQQHIGGLNVGHSAQVVFIANVQKRAVLFHT